MGRDLGPVYEEQSGRTGHENDGECDTQRQSYNTCLTICKQMSTELMN